MENIALLGREVEANVVPTYQAYAKILAESSNARKIHSTQVATYSYGPHNRHQLDIYDPSDYVSTALPLSTRGRPLLLYVYGGGFIMGDKVVPEFPGNLVYSNIGSFFADRFGVQVVIIDYRLVKHGAHYPSGGEDLNMALQWLRQRFLSESRSLFLMGNSAGGAHIATWLYDGRFARDRKLFMVEDTSMALRGVVFLSTPLTIQPSLEPMFESYYGPVTESRKAQPLALMKEAMKRSGTEEKEAWPDLLVLVAELDPETLFESAEDFSNAWAEIGGTSSQQILRGHNHLSPPLSLGTNIDEEEEWGVTVAKWIGSHL